MDKFFNAFGFGVAVLLASTLASESPRVAVESPLVPATTVAVTDPIAAQGNSAVREIESDARVGAQSAQPTRLQELAAN